MQETIKRTCIQKSQQKRQMITSKLVIIINYHAKLLFNYSYFDKLSAYTYDNFR